MKKIGLTLAMIFGLVVGLSSCSSPLNNTYLEVPNSYKEYRIDAFHTDIGWLNVIVNTENNSIEKVYKMDRKTLDTKWYGYTSSGTYYSAYLEIDRKGTPVLSMEYDYGSHTDYSNIYGVLVN